VNILVVDDDPIVLASCRRVLEAEGYDVVTVASVGEALEAVAQREYGLMLIDVKMPERDGFQLMAKMTEWRLRVPIIVMSGYTTSETVLASLQGGAFAFIPKPFTPEELLASVRVAVSAEHQGG